MVLVDLLAGTVAGFAICAVGHPFDTLKVLMQMQPDKYPTLAASARSTLAQHGVAGLYRGVASPLIGNALYNAVQFAVFARLKDAFTEQGRVVDLNRIGAAAACTGVFVAMVEGPQDLFKSQMQAQMLKSSSPAYSGTLDCARTILRERGVAGLGQGLLSTVGRNIVGVCAYFVFYDAVRMGMAGERPLSSLSTLQVLLAGGCGGLGYWVLCYPLDIIKSAIQTDSIHPAQRKYKGFLHAAQALWVEGGVKRYTAGLAPCLVRSFPANAAGFAAYETVKRVMSPPLQ